MGKTNVIMGYIWPKKFGQLNSIGSQRKKITGVLSISETLMIEGSLKIKDQTFNFSGNLSDNRKKMAMFLTRDAQKIRLSLKKIEREPIAESWEGVLSLEESMGISITML